MFVIKENGNTDFNWYVVVFIDSIGDHPSKVKYNYSITECLEDATKFTYKWQADGFIKTLNDCNKLRFDVKSYSVIDV